MFDVLLTIYRLLSKIQKYYKELCSKSRNYCLATVHRAENTDNRKNLENIVYAFIESRELIVFPAHPRAIEFLKVYELLSKIEETDNVLLIKPVGHLDMLILEKNAKKILTDSGGV